MYKIKIENNNNSKKIEIPETPFFLSHCDGKSYYIVSKNSDKDRYLLTAVDNGITYDNNYVGKQVYNNLNNGTWILHESKIVII